MMMQFVCTARSADDEDYRPLAETPLTLDFAYDHGVSTLADPAVWQVTLTNNAAAPRHAPLPRGRAAGRGRYPRRLAARR